MDRVRRRTLLLAVNPLTALAVLPLLAVHDARRRLDHLRGRRGLRRVLHAARLRPVRAAADAPPDELLGTANAALQTVREGLRLVAPLAGAGLYTVAGGAAVALLDAATFLAATVALLALRSASRARPPPASLAHRGRRRARHVIAVVRFRAMILGCAVSLFVIGFSETLVFEFPHALGARPFVGVLMAVQGSGRSPVRSRRRA